MRPPTCPESVPEDTSQVRLALLVSQEHPLYRLAEAIDWASFEAELGLLYAEAVGRPGLPTRLMVGLHYLKYLFDESDESVVAKFVENPYWQFFCGAGAPTSSTSCPVTRPPWSSGGTASVPRASRSS